MNFEYSDKMRDLIARTEAFMDEHIYSADREIHAWQYDPNKLWQPWPGLKQDFAA